MRFGDIATGNLIDEFKDSHSRLKDISHPENCDGWPSLLDNPGTLSKHPENIRIDSQAPTLARTASFPLNIDHRRAILSRQCSIPLSRHVHLAKPSSRVSSYSPIEGKQDSVRVPRCPCLLRSALHAIDVSHIRPCPQSYPHIQPVGFCFFQICSHLRWRALTSSARRRRLRRVASRLDR